MNRPLTPDQLASRWLCSAETIRSLCASGKLRAFRVGTMWRIPAAAVEEYEQCGNTGSGDLAGGSSSPGQTTDDGGAIVLTHARPRKPKAQRARSDRPASEERIADRFYGPAWAIMKAAVFDRDGEKCTYCGDESGPFHLDHVVPLSRGGGNIYGNLVVACAKCNVAKGDKLLESATSCATPSPAGPSDRGSGQAG